MRVHGLDHLVVNSADVERALTFYTELLGMDGVRVEEWRTGAAPFPSVRVDPTTIIDLVAAPPTGVNVDHLCLVVERADVDAVAGDPRFEMVGGPGSRYGARGDGWSVYVRDSDGNTVELRSY